VLVNQPANIWQTVSFTKRDDLNGLVNSSVRHDVIDDWGDALAVGQRYFEEVAQGPACPHLATWWLHEGQNAKSPGF